MTTLSKKMLGYALGRTVLASDRPLHRRDDGGRRRRVVLGSGASRSSPAGSSAIAPATTPSAAGATVTAAAGQRAITRRS